MADEVRCQEKVFPKERFGAFHGYQCTFKATVQREGKWFCKKHDPEYIKAKREESFRLWDEKQSREAKARDKSILITRAFEGITLEQIEERKAAGQCPCCGVQK